MIKFMYNEKIFTDFLKFNTWIKISKLKDNLLNKTWIKAINITKKNINWVNILNHIIEIRIIIFCFHSVYCKNSK